MTDKEFQSCLICFEGQIDFLSLYPSIFCACVFPYVLFYVLFYLAIFFTVNIDFCCVIRACFPLRAIFGAFLRFI
jgi:hypothetical protein